MTDNRSGTALPWAAFTLGASGSLAANLLYALDAVNKVAGSSAVPWQGLSAALFFAALVPVALLLVVELLLRSGTGRDGLTVVMWAGAAVVAVGAAIMSFGHMYAVMISLGQPPLFAALMPLAVDGLMLVASVALARSGRVARVETTSAVPEAVPEPVEAVPHVPEAVPETVPHAVEAVPEPRKAGNAAEEARQFVRNALEHGRKVTGEEVAASIAAHGPRSARWGRLRIAEVKDAA